MVVSLVALTTLTAPTFGVYLGGTVVDSLGGHKTAPRATLIFLVVGAAVANCCGLIACFCPMFWPAVLGFWAFNMAGAALMPGAFGLMLSAVSSRRRALASAMAQLPINLLGMAGGAFIPGWIAGCEPPEKVLPCSAGCDYAVGLRTLLFGPGVGIVLLFFSFLLVKNTTVSTESQSESTELSSSIPSRRAKRERPSGSNTLVLGIIDQLDGKAGTLVVSLDEPRPFKELLARAAIHTGNSTRRLFSEDGVEILGIDDIKRIHESSKTTPKPRVVTEESTKKQLQIDLEVVSTDGSDFKWKWGAGHASYKFGDLLIRPLWRTLAGSKQSRKVVHPPQPIPLPTTGNLKDGLPDLWIQCFPLVEKYGPLIRLRIFDDVVYVCADPDTVDIVNQIPDKRLPKEVFGCKALANQGVFIADGQRWEFGRHALQAQLTPEAIDSLIPIFAERCVKLQAIIDSHPRDMDIFAWVEKVTMDTICNVGFGHDLKCIESAEMPPLLPLFEEVLEISINSSLYGAFDVLGTRKRWFEGQLSKLDGMLDEIIDAVRSGTHSGSSESLLHHLINAKCPLTQRSFTQSELRDQLLTMLVAGHKTTTLLLTWALYYIARNPRIEKKLFAELRQVFENDMNRLPVGDDLRRLKYMDMVVRETLRLCSPVQVAQRGLTQPVQCGKYTLLPGGHSGRGNSWIAIHIMGISHSKKLWGENAEDFIPERFETDKMKHFHPFQFIPFGGGRRLCIGNLFAITQAKTLLCMILRKYYLRSVAEKPIRIDPKDIATPLSAERGGGVWLHFTSRDYDEPEDVVPPQPSHGALCRSFVKESLERSRPGTSFAGSSFIGRGSFLSGPPPPFLLLWGGEFKTTQSAAQDLAKTAQSRGLKVELKTMDEVSPKDLVAGKIKIDGQIPVVLIMVATYNGHPPENAAGFYKALSEHPASEPGKSELQYAVLGVGNSQWVSTFVKVAKMVDKDLARVGAQRLLPFEVADKNDCFDQSVRSWRKALFSMFASSPEQLVMEQETEQFAEVMEERLQLEAVASGKVAAPLTDHFLRSGYQNCKISLNKELCLQTTADSPSVRQILVERPDGTPYACGDHLEVMPKNSDTQVMRACMRLGCHSDSLVVVKASSGTEDELPQGQTLSIGDILTHYVDLQALPSQETLASLVKLASKSQEVQALRHLSEVKEDSEYDKWKSKCLSILDVLEEFRSISIGFSRFVEVSPRIHPRLYSIASSPLLRGSTVELCCRVAQYTATPLNQQSARTGLCSSMLAAAESVICRVKEAPHMRLPEDYSKPIACVCGGTGLAPFFGFLQERDALRKQGIHTGIVHLYFGCRNEVDFLHKSQLEKWHEEGLCSLKVSLSRPDSGSKEYVYHRLRAESASVLELLGDGPNGGYFYVCGSASTLAKDVTNVLGDLLSESGDAVVGFTKLNELQDSGRVIFDVWG